MIQDGKSKNIKRVSLLQCDIYFLYILLQLFVVIVIFLV